VEVTVTGGSVKVTLSVLVIARKDSEATGTLGDALEGVFVMVRELDPSASRGIWLRAGLNPLEGADEQPALSIMKAAVC
jgi:hypothetical protein